MSKLTREQLARAKAARENMSAGRVASQVPPAREGFTQYISTKEKAEERLKNPDLGYTARLDNNGNPMHIKDGKGEEMVILEIPTELWEAGQEYKNQKAQEKVESLQPMRTYGSEGVFSGATGSGLTRGFANKSN